ncbi:MAG: response regulator [Actinomycetota bacterium]
MRGPETELNPSTRKVLVIDDDGAIRNLLRMVLEVEGHEVVEAETGSEGLVVAQRHQPDVVIVDYMMPGTDGETTGRQLRRIVPDATLIAFSAFLINKPYWADLYLAKTQVNDLPELVLRDRAAH